MSSYQFPNIVCNKVGACDQYIRANIDWVSNFDGISTGPMTIYTNNPLTDIELTNLTTLINSYVDPAVFLAFDHAETLPLHSNFNTDADTDIINQKSVIQTFIYSTLNIRKPTVLDAMKTIVEYNCPNVQNYLNTTTGNISLEIYDTTRNVSITTNIIDLNEIAVNWNILAQTGSTEGNTIYRSALFTGLMNKSPDYDVVLQLRGLTSDSKCEFRCHSLQFIYYNVE